MSNTPELITAYVTEGKIEGYRIIAFGEDKNGAKQATEVTDKLIGISTRVPKDPGEHVDVVRSGLYPVMYGADIKRGDPLTTDAKGRSLHRVCRRRWRRR